MPEGYPDAVVRPRTAERVVDIRRSEAAEDLAWCVDYHWYVGWDLDEPHRQQVVPQPRVHLAVEEGRILVHGVSREPFERVLRGRGHALGSSLHPGALRPLVRGPVGALSGRVLPAADVLGPDDRPVAAAVLGTDDVAEMVAALEGYLRRLPAAADPNVAEVRRLVALAEEDRSLTRAEALAERAGTSLRSLQRLFTEYVGVGPKWVVQRFRILDAAAAAHEAGPVDWAALAVELGFSDQAHLVRVFAQVVGTPPATYAKDL